jgi:hypothetical protein
MLVQGELLQTSHCSSALLLLSLIALLVLVFGAGRIEE